MFAPVFSLKLKHKIHPRVVTVGKYDGERPCLSCGTTASKVFIHNPHGSATSGGRVAVDDSGISLLNVNQSVTALKAGRLDPSINRDILCIGSQTNLLAYDVHDNKDLFYNEVPDGVNSLVIGNIANVYCPIVIAGGNCTLLGFDADGRDKFWTVTGDMVHSLALADFTGDGINELIVGSEDYEIRAIHFDEIIAEISETEAVTGLCSISGSCFGYSLANGTIGAYDKTTRYWRIKSKNQVTAIHGYDMDCDGVPEVVAGWSNGKVEARSATTGDVLFTDQMTSAIAGLVDADYRLDGKNQLICCSVDGEVNGYQGDAATARAVRALKAEENIRELLALKQNLLLELKNYEANSQAVNAGSLTAAQMLEQGAIPSETEVEIDLTVQQTPKPAIMLTAKTNTKTIIRMVVIFAEGLFVGESFVVHPPPTSVSDQVLVAIQPIKDVAVGMQVHSFVSLPGSSIFHVFTKQVNLPRFSSYIQSPPSKTPPESNVTFTINERLERIVIWMSENFLLSKEVPCNSMINVKFTSIKEGDFQFKMEENGRVIINTESMELAGDVIQSLAAFLRLENLQVVAHFPLLFKSLTETMDSVANLHAVTQKLAAEMTDHSNLIRSLVVRAEDARLQDDYPAMRKGYMELHDLNRDLIDGYHVRSTNHEELVKSLKNVNQIIQKASQLRVGKYQTMVVSQCREAIKNNKTSTLIKIIQVGSA